jgi:hypothetical protein
VVVEELEPLETLGDDPDEPDPTGFWVVEPPPPPPPPHADNPKAKKKQNERFSNGRNVFPRFFVKNPASSLTKNESKIEKKSRVPISNTNYSPHKFVRNSERRDETGDEDK